MSATIAPKPMLATLGSLEALENGSEDLDDWAFEMKWDGVRTIAVVSDGTLRLFSRNGVDVTATYPELAGLPALLGTDAVLDGEVVALNKRGRPDFGRLQLRMKLTRAPEVAAARALTPVQFLIFDVLEAKLDGRTRSLVKEPYLTRREILARLLANAPAAGPIQVPPAFDGDLDAAFDSSRELGLEGVMAKRRDSTYLPGKRSPSWVKVKHHRTQEVVIGGWRPGKGRRANGVGSLLLGVPGTDGLHYVGRVGSGFGDRDLDELLHRLTPLARSTTPFFDVPRADASDAHWVTPKFVGEVEFSEWTRDNRLRQPTWRGWRPDKAPSDVVREG
jgi:bifunctional non-homologous end joining protein LigD